MWPAQHGSSSATYSKYKNKLENEILLSFRLFPLGQSRQLHVSSMPAPVHAGSKPYVLVVEFDPRRPLAEPDCQPQSPTAYQSLSRCSCHAALRAIVASKSAGRSATEAMLRHLCRAWCIIEHKRERAACFWLCQLEGNRDLPQVLTPAPQLHHSLL